MRYNSAESEILILLALQQQENDKLGSVPPRGVYQQNQWEAFGSYHEETLQSLWRKQPAVKMQSKTKPHVATEVRNSTRRANMVLIYGVLTQRSREVSRM